MTWRSPETYQQAGIERGTATSNSTTTGTTSFRLVVRDLATGTEVNFEEPVTENSRGPGGWIEPISWASDSRHLVVQVGSIGPPGVAPQFWYIDTLAAGPTLDGDPLPGLDHARGPYGIAALGTSGEWAAVVSADGGKGPVRIVTWDLHRARSKRVLDRLPASRELGAAALVRVVGDPSGRALLMLVGEENFGSRLYELEIATKETRLLQDAEVVHAGWQVPEAS